MGWLTHITQQNTCASEELAATSEEMSNQAQELQRLMGFFILSDGYKNNVIDIGTQDVNGLSAGDPQHKEAFKQCSALSWA
jgi:methyl-accepting chemotaxis protein